MIKNLLSAIILLLCLQGHSQLVIPEIPAITKEDLAQKVHPQDSTATAAFLYRRGKTWFELNNNLWVMITEVYTRIKIYKKEGYSYANPEITFYSGDRSAKGYFNEASTYNLTGGTLERTTLKKDSEFEKELRENVTEKKITLPNVKEGSIIEYKYTIKTPYFTDLRDFYFQHEVPANDVRYDVWIPVYFYYNIYTRGAGIIENSDNKTVKNERTDTNERYYCYTAKNVKALKDESYVDNIDNYTAVLQHELSAVGMPNQQPKYYATDWKTVAKKIYDNDNFGRELRFNSYFEDSIDPLLAKATTDAEKATMIFDFVKARMNWNQELGYLCDTGVKKAYEAKVGNVAEINLMLTAMLRYAKLDANPVLVSTRGNGVALYASRTAYNYVIAAVKLNNKTVLLDATGKYTQPDVLPVRAVNWTGRLIKKNGDTEEADLIPKTLSKEVITLSCTLNSDGVIAGKARDQYLDYNAYLFRDKYAGMQQDSYLEKMENNYKGITINDYKVTNLKDVTKPLIEDYSFTHNNVADIIGNKIYFSPMLFFERNENPFKQETREYPVDFIFPHEDKYIIAITIPDGYKIESLPKPLAISMVENIGSFKYNIQANGNSIQLSAVFDINFSNVSPDYYKTLKDFFQKMIEKQNEQIVLVKA